MSVSNLWICDLYPAIVQRPDIQPVSRNLPRITLCFRMLRLPNELLLNISNCLFYVDDELHTFGAKRDLLALRLTCRRLANFCRSLVFKHITITHRGGSFKKLNAMAACTHVCGSIQCITYDFEDFGIYITTSECAKLRLMVSDIARHKKDPTECRDLDLLEESTIDSSNLAAAISKFHCLRAIRLVRDLGVMNVGFIRPWRILDSPFSYSKAGQQLFEIITSALSASGHRIEEFVIGSFYPDGLSLPAVIQSLTPSRSNLYQQAFGSLNKLKILLPGRIRDAGSHRKAAMNYAGLSVLIQSMPLLEHLELEADKVSYNTMSDEFLQSLVIPKLQSIALDLLPLQSPIGLVEFFREHASTLRQANLRSLLLETGTWEAVFSAMRKLLDLSSLELLDYDENRWGYGAKGLDATGYSLLPGYILRKSETSPFDL